MGLSWVKLKLLDIVGWWSDKMKVIPKSTQFKFKLKLKLEWGMAIF